MFVENYNKGTQLWHIFNSNKLCGISPKKKIKYICNKYDDTITKKVNVQGPKARPAIMMPKVRRQQ